MKKMRIDLLLVERGLAESRSQAQRLVMAGQVRVKGQLVQKPSVSFQNDVEIQKSFEVVTIDGEVKEYIKKSPDVDKDQIQKSIQKPYSDSTSQE